MTGEFLSTKKKNNNIINKISSAGESDMVIYLELLNDIKEARDLFWKFEPFSIQIFNNKEF